MNAGEPTQVEGLISECPFCQLCCLIKSITHCHELFIYRCNLTKDKQIHKKTDTQTQTHTRTQTLTKTQTHTQTDTDTQTDKQKVG